MRKRKLLYKYAKNYNMQLIGQIDNYHCNNRSCGIQTMTQMKEGRRYLRPPRERVIVILKNSDFPQEEQNEQEEKQHL